MAIVACPFCGKRISSKAASCAHCEQNLAQVSPEQIARTQRDNRLGKAQSINNQAMIAMVIFLGSFLWYYFHAAEPGSLEMWANYATMLLGGGWYLISKIRMVLFKRQ